MSVQIRPIASAQMMLCIFLIVFSSIGSAAERYGVIEIGSTGVRGITCTVNKDSVGKIKTSPSKEYAPLNVELLAQWDKEKNAFSGPGYEQAISRIEELVREMNADGIPNDSVVMFVSSGLDAAAGKDKASTKVKLSPALSQIRKDIPVFGQKIRYLDPEEEATYAFLGNLSLIPNSPWKYLVDIGGGNTKGALQLPKGPLDSKRLGDGVRAITAKDQPAIKAALVEVLEGVAKQSQGIGVSDGSTYVVGGISFIVATITEAKHGRKAADGDNLFTISRSDIDEFLSVVAPQGKALEDGKQRLFDAYIDKLANSGDPLLASLQQAKQIPYTPDGLKNGANLLLAVMDGLKKAGVARADELVFIRNSLYSIPVAYLEAKVVPADNALPLLLEEKKSEIETQIKDLEKKIDKSIRDKNDEQTSLLRGDLEKIRSEIASLNASIKSQGEAVRKEIQESSKKVLDELKALKQAIQQQSTQRVTNLPNDRESAVLLLSEALRHRKSGCLDMAFTKLDEAISHSVMESDVWLVRAIVAKEIGDDGTAQDSILAAARLIESGKFSKSKLAQSLERVQGASRAAAETDLLTARVHLASAPKANTKK